MKHSAGLVARFLGPPEIELDGAPVHIERHKAVALFAYVAVTGQRLGRDTLAALFWPDYEGAQANAYLRRTLWELRKALGECCLEIDRQAVAPLPGASAWVDVARFQELLATAAASGDRCGALEEAAALYRGDFMAGFSLRDSPDFDEWQSLQTEALHRQFGEALASLAAAYGERGDYEAAMATAQRWLALDPLDEAAHRALMQLHAWSGRRSAAIHQYEACVATLQQELGAPPEPETTALYERIRSGAVGRRKAEAPPALAVPNLPVDPTAFVGREDELAEIARLLAGPDCRLLTLVGTGGVGKTRLAVQAARTQAGAFAHGVAFVPLSAQGADEAVVPAVAEQLEPAFRGDGPAQRPPAEARRQLLDFLAGRAQLVVLDNAEHLAAAVAGLASDLLPAAPRVKLLVTSRERLRLPEEWVLEVRGLAYPGPGRTGDLAAYPAVQLFLEVAQRAQVGLRLQPADWLAVAEICRLVEGMPLAIELAAPWVRVLSCPEIAAEIARNQDFLTSTARGVPERHRSLRAAFEHSWQFLAPAERQVFSRLAVFQGGFTRQAAAQVADAGLAGLSALADKSLLQRDRAGRYDLHQLLKQYAAEKLSLSPEVEQEVRVRHHTYYLDWLCTVGEGLKGHDQYGTVALLEGEAGNLGLAWEHALAAGDWERARRALPLWGLFIEMGPVRAQGGEAIRRAIPLVRAAVANDGPGTTLNALLALLLAVRRFLSMSLEPGLPPGPLVAESLALADGLGTCQEKALVYLLNSVGPGLSSPPQSQALAARSRAVFEALDDRWGMAMAELVWADTAILGLGDPVAARPGYEAAREAFQALGNRWGEAMCLVGLTAIAQREKRYDEALELGREGLAVYRELGNAWRLVDALEQMGRLACDAGDYAAARAFLEETGPLLEEMGQRTRAACDLAALGHIARRLGDAAGARGYLERALALYRELGDQEGMDNASQSLAELEREV
jgi:predicted ATPase/DNA-binding SARP family transcriptional activator